MPIRTKPWSDVTLQDVQDLISREVREDSTIEFKRELNIASREEKAEFLKDVTAMANGVGGTIDYGAIEGEGDQRGQIVQCQGQVLDRDAVELQITNLFRDGLDERLDGVLFKALPTAAGEYVVVLRIPASPLAPHRITYGKSQFYMRGSVSNEPMNTRQIREMILQRETAVEKALRLIDERTRALKEAGIKRHDVLHFGPAPFTNPDQVVLYVIPLFPEPGGWRLGPESQARLMSVPPLGAPEAFEHPFYSAEGMYSRFRHRRHVLFLRQGGIEFQRFDVLDRAGQVGTPPRLRAWAVEMDLLNALKQCELLTEDGLLPLPVLVSIRFLAVDGTCLQKYPRDSFYSEHLQVESDVLLTPVVLRAWGPPAAEQIQQVFHEMWQAWHLAASTNFHPDGVHHEYDSDGSLVQRLVDDPGQGG